MNVDIKNMLVFRPKIEMKVNESKEITNCSYQLGTNRNRKEALFVWEI